jgi:hypothetical protein
MTPKDKAKELVDKYSNQLEDIARIADEWSMSEFSQFRQIIAIKCASLAVDETINTLKIFPEKDTTSKSVVNFSVSRIMYWVTVKQELEKL